MAEPEIKIQGQVVHVREGAQEALDMVDVRQGRDGGRKGFITMQLTLWAERELDPTTTLGKTTN